MKKGSRVFIHTQSIEETKKIEEALKKDPDNIAYSVFEKNEIAITGTDSAIAKHMKALKEQNLLSNNILHSRDLGKNNFHKK